MTYKYIKVFNSANYIGNIDILIVFVPKLKSMCIVSQSTNLDV